MMRSFRHVALALGGFALLAAALFAPAWRGDRRFMSLSTDPLLPWRTERTAVEIAAARAAGNAELSDQLFLLQPGAYAVQQSVARGEWPTWNPAVAGGVPLLGEALDGALYPPNLLLWHWLPIERAFAWSAALHVVLAALGARWFARRLGAEHGPALLAGALFATAGSLTVRFHYPMTFHAACWVPWLLAAVHAFAERRSAWRLAAISPPIALIILCGFPQTGLYGIAGAAAWGVLLLLRARGFAAWRAGAALGAAFALGLLLAAPQVLTVDATLPRSLQRPHRALQQIEEAATPAALLGLVAPGTFVDGREAWSLDFGRNPLWNALYARTRPADDGGALPVGHGATPSTTETTCYAGALALGLMLAALCARPRAGLGVALGLLTALLLCWSYALGAPWLVQAVAALPRFDIGEVRRILPTIGLLTAVLATFGARRFVAPDGRLARFAAVGVTAAIGTALLALAAYVGQIGPAGLADSFHELQVARYGAARVAANAAMTARSIEQDAAIHAFVVGHAWRAAAWFGGATVALLLAAALAARSRPKLALAVLGLFAVADLGALHFRVNRFLPAERFATSPPVLAPLAAAESGGRIRRYAPDWRRGDDMIERLPLPPNLGSLYGIADGDGYLVMLPTRYARFVRALEPEAAPGETAVPVAAYPLHQRDALRSPLLLAASVRHLLSRHDLVAELAAAGGDAAGWREIAREGELRIFTNARAAPLAFVVPEARFLPPAPADDAIGTEAEGFAAPISADAAARARWHAAALADLAGPAVAGRARFAEHVWLEGGAPPVAATSEPNGFYAATASLPLADGSALAVASRRVVEAPSRVAGFVHSATRWRIVLEPGRGGFLVVNDGFDPGWRATVDGVATPVLPANVAFRGIVLPPGAREVVLEHRPPELARGLLLAAISASALLVLLLAGAVSAWRARRPARAPAPPAP